MPNIESVEISSKLVAGCIDKSRSPLTLFTDGKRVGGLQEAERLSGSIGTRQRRRNKNSARVAHGRARILLKGGEMKDAKALSVDPTVAFQRFERAVRHIVTVPKAQMLELENKNGHSRPGRNGTKRQKVKR